MLVKEVWCITRKEVRHFCAADKSTLALFILMLLFWGIFIRNSAGQAGAEGHLPLWWLFLSIVISANLSHMAFTLERMNGNLEILLTSGVSRGAVLAGKVLFVIVAGMMFGAASMAASRLFKGIMPDPSAREGMMGMVRGIGIFMCASFMHATLNAWLSVRFSNPRMIYFVSFFSMALVVGLYVTVSALTGLQRPVLLPVFFTAGGILFGMFARRAFQGERVIQPISY